MPNDDYKLFFGDVNCHSTWNDRIAVNNMVKMWQYCLTNNDFSYMNIEHPFHMYQERQLVQIKEGLETKVMSKLNKSIITGTEMIVLYHNQITINELIILKGTTIRG